jgi:adenylate cyclase
MRRSLVWILPSILFAACLSLRLWDPVFVQDFRLRLFDAYQELKPRPYTDVPVRFVDIDDASLARFGQWPWPRTLLARLVNRLTEAGAATVVFDVVFAEPDRTSPSLIAAQWPNDERFRALRDTLKTLPNYDDLFAEAIAGSNVVAGFVTTGESSSRRPPRKFGIASAGQDPKPFLAAFPGAVLNLPVIERAARGNAAMNITPERDGVVRRIPLLVRLDDRIYPTLPAEALRVAQGASTFIVKNAGASGEAAFGTPSGIVEVRTGRFAAPTDSAGRVWLYETRPAPQRTVSAWQVLENKVAPGRLEGAIVFVGTSAAGLLDLKTTALHPAVAGATLQAQVVEQILTGAFLKRPDWSNGAEILFLALFGVVAIPLFARAGAAWGGATVLLAIGGAFAASWYAFSMAGMLLDPLYPAIAVIVVSLASSLSSYAVTENRRRQLRHAFAHYVSPVLVEKLIARPSELGLGGEIRNISILFSDVRSFTGIAERLNAQELTSLINRLLSPLTQEILSYGGTVDKYMGDAVMAFWNAPLRDPDHARKACLAALAMHRSLKVLNAELAQEIPADGGAPLQIRIGVGIATGDCCVGNFGSAQRFDYSAIGDSVNTASRLEGMTKQYGVGVIVAETTRNEAGDLAMLEIDLVRAVGKSVAVRIYAVLGDETMAAEPSFDAFRAGHDAMLAAYRRCDWPAARGLVADCRRRDPSLAALYDLYESRIAEFEAAPLGADWDGVYVSQKK